MENFIVYGSAALFFVCVLPVYVSVYAYADTHNKFASANFRLYRVFKFLDMNTEEDGRIMINGKNASVNPVIAVRDGKIAFDNLCIFKIIQLSDFGLASERGAYAALIQSALTFPLYSYIKNKGSKCKLKNYIVLNAEHDGIIYSAKIVSVINLLVAFKILFILFLERIDEN